VGVGVTIGEVVSHGGGSSAAGSAGTTRGSVPTSARHSRSTSASTTTTIAPNVYQPSTVSGGLVTYQVPAGAHTIAFFSSGVCWVGVKSPSTGQYLWMDTLAAGSSASYAASSNVVVRIGAPTVVAVRVDGIPVAFPKGQTQPFDVALASPTG
jgi:hypothetical protein